MTTSARNKVELLPAWLLRAIARGEPEDDVLNDKRQEPRRIAGLLINVQRDDDSNANPSPVRLWTVSTRGIGFRARIPFAQGDLLKLTPDDAPDQPVHVSVVHCTQQVHGYLIGCVIESA